MPRRVQQISKGPTLRLGRLERGQALLELLLKFGSHLANGLSTEYKMSFGAKLLLIACGNQNYAGDGGC